MVVALFRSVCSCVQRVLLVVVVVIFWCYGGIYSSMRILFLFRVFLSIKFIFLLQLSDVSIFRHLIHSCCLFGTLEPSK